VAQSTVPVTVVGGRPEATWTLPSATVGTHQVTAVYGGDPVFAASSALLTQTVSRAPSTTALVANPSSPMAGQRISLVATISGTGGAVPTGTVTFLDGRVHLGTVALTPDPRALGASRANSATGVLVVTFASGTHAISAIYSGDSVYLPSSAATALPVASADPPVVDGPRVVSVVRYGFHAQPTQFVLTFDEALDSTSATRPANYRLVTLGGEGRGGHRRGADNPIASVDYSPGSRSVTLHPVHRIDVHNVYRLIVNPTPEGGIADSAGHLLDGQGEKRPGTAFTTVLTRRNLAGPSWTEHGRKRGT
jgi:hypothetical protein